MDTLRHVINQTGGYSDGLGGNSLYSPHNLNVSTLGNQIRRAVGTASGKQGLINEWPFDLASQLVARWGRQHFFCTFIL